MTQRRVEEFTKADPELNRRLRALQDATHEKQRELEQTTDRRLRPTPVVVAEYHAKFGEMVKCDPSGAGFTVFLPNAVESDAGKRLMVKNITSSTNVILVTPTGGAELDGAAGLGINVAQGTASLLFDGQNWWRE